MTPQYDDPATWNGCESYEAALEARIAELETALDKATDLLAMVGTEPLDEFRALIKPLKPQA